MKNNFTLTFALLLCLFWIGGNAQTQFWSDTFDASPTSGTRTPEENGGLGGPPNTSYFRLSDGSTISQIVPEFSPTNHLLINEELKANLQSRSLSIH